MHIHTYIHVYINLFSLILSIFFSYIPVLLPFSLPSPIFLSHHLLDKELSENKSVKEKVASLLELSDTEQDFAC